MPKLPKCLIYHLEFSQLNAIKGSICCLLCLQLFPSRLNIHVHAKRNTQAKPSPFPINSTHTASTGQQQCGRRACPMRASCFTSVKVNCTQSPSTQQRQTSAYALFCFALAFALAFSALRSSSALVNPNSSIL